VRSEQERNSRLRKEEPGSLRGHEGKANAAFGGGGGGEERAEKKRLWGAREEGRGIFNQITGSSARGRVEEGQCQMRIDEIKKKGSVSHS